MSGKDAAVLRGFVKQLPRVDRLIMLLWYADGLNVAEIAAVLELGEAEVSRRLESLRGRAREAMALAQGGGDTPTIAALA